MFEYHLSDEEILDALEKGSDRAKEIIGDSKNLDDLQSKFVSAIYGADHLLERFTIDGFENGDKLYSHSGEKTPLQRLKKMMVKAFQAVQTVRELENVLDSINPDKPPLGIAIKKTALLFSAAAVFESKGKSDTPSNRVLKIIRNYQETPHAHFRAA